MSHGRPGAALVALGLAVALGAASCSDDGGSDEALCALVEDTTAFTGRFGDGLDPTDTERALEQLHAAQADLQRLRAAAPSAVDDALEYLDALVEVLETTDPADPAAVVSAVNALEEERAAAEVASLELQGWAAETC